MHGNHAGKDTSCFSIFEELSADSHKDNSKMLRGCVTHGYYLRVSEFFFNKAVLHFVSTYINNQVIVCESRSLRRSINPGLFLMMMQLPEVGKSKNDIETFLPLAN